MARGLPAGTVTFMFTDVEGSTSLLHRLGAERFAQVLQRHRDVVRTAVAQHGGVEVDTQGDAFFVAFPQATGAVGAARAVQAELAATGELRIRIGLHTGSPLLAEEGYVGADVHLGARVAAAGHGGQVLLSAATQALVDAPVTRLGEHRLKDFERLVTIYQLGTEPFPPLKTLSTTQLPHPASSFVGRADQVKDVLALVRDGGARLLTLTGPGGSGKTRLAIEVAAELVGTVEARVVWVGLADVRDPALVLPTVAQAVGGSEDVAESIGDRELVLVLDNLEQVVGAAADLADLLERCPHLTMLTTSRERLRVRGEQEYAVPPLSSPEAVELFSNRAQVPADPDVQELCERLDNLPLAVELAAARARVLTPRQILERLGRRLDLLKGGRDAADRQQTLRGTLDWSYALLDPHEQELFARLSVFAGGADLAAAEAVLDADLDVLESLVDKSLVQFEDGRFRLLETMRQYAAERLVESGSERDVAARHAEHFLALAEELRPEVFGLDPHAALDRLEEEHDNLRAALTWFEEHGHVQQALRMAGELWEFWCLRTHFREGFDRLEHLLALDPSPTAARVAALTGSVHLAGGAGADDALARARADEALALARELGSPWDLAFAEHQHAQMFAVEGDHAAALRLIEPVVQRWRELGDQHRELQAMRVAAVALLELGEVEQSRRRQEEILRRGREIGDHEVQWWSLSALASMASRSGNHAEALQHVLHEHAVQGVMGEEALRGNTMLDLAAVLARAQAYESAVHALAVAERLDETTDFVYPAWLAAPRNEALARCREALGDTGFEEAWRRGRSMSEQDVLEAAALAVPGP
jgi:predicted ATPase/class 3 adenylate cyclase